MPNSLEKKFHFAQEIPHINLATLPTPVEKLTIFDNLDLWVKRDDLSGEEYAGNKIRKLEYLFGDALAKNKTEVWTVGAIGSHHVLATSIFAQKLNLRCNALHFPQPITQHVRNNILALSTTHPTLNLIGHKALLPSSMFKVKLQEWKSKAPHTYYIPGGGSSPVGTLGYVNAALELCEQIDNGELPCPDEIYVAAGTCGTLAGLTLGFALGQKEIKIIGVRVVEKFVANVPLACRLANQTIDLLRSYGIELSKFSHRDFTILNDAFGHGYGKSTPEGEQMIKKYKGILDLEPTYTAKTVAAMHRNAQPGKHILYWHTFSGADLSDRIDAGDLSALPEAYLDFFDV